MCYLRSETLKKNKNSVTFLRHGLINALPGLPVVVYIENNIKYKLLLYIGRRQLRCKRYRGSLLK